MKICIVIIQLLLKWYIYSQLLYNFFNKLTFKGKEISFLLMN